MTKIAIDIVLLPSDELTDIVIKANNNLTCQSERKIVLNKKDCLPHISLAMGCIEQENITEIEKILHSLKEQYFPNQLKVIGVYIGTDAAGEKVSLYHIEKTKTLQLLHENIMTKLSPFFSYDVTPDMLLNPTDIEESTLLWIRNFPAYSSFENFLPHITIGFGQAQALDSQIKFKPSKLAVCQLGNHCTCRKILLAIEPDI